MNRSSIASLQTPTPLQSVERDLLDQTGTTTLAWCGRAATALYWAYRLARLRQPQNNRPEVILPAIMCGTPANAAYLAGMTSRFADTDPQTGLITLEAIQARVTPFTCAVVVVHLFGQTVDLSAISVWCRQNGIVLIEDIAQAQGARLPDDTPVGSRGDMAVFSFNKTKILETGGGALAVRHTQDAQALHHLLQTEPLAQVPEPESMQQLGLSYRNLHHSLVGLLRQKAAAEHDVSDSFLRLRPSYDALYRTPMPENSSLGRDWLALDAIVTRRFQKAKLYSSLLHDGPWTLLDGWLSSGVCWRYSLLLDDPTKTAQLSEQVRKDGFHVSNLYWPANQLFYPADHCPAAADFAQRVVNLWVDDSVDSQWIERCCASIRHHSALIKN